MKKIILFLSILLSSLVFTTASAQHITRDSVRKIWSGRLVPGFQKDSATWAAFWNIKDDGAPVVFPSAYSASVASNDTMVIKTVAGLNKKITAGELTGGLPYKVWTALVSQTSTFPPSAVYILQNTLGGSVSFSYGSAGVYGLSSSALFGDGTKTTIYVIPRAHNTQFDTGYTSSSSLSLHAFTNAGTATDGLLNLTLVEIRVYP